MTLAVFTRHIGHYHDARYRAVAAMGIPFTVIATQNEADFAEFMASHVNRYSVQQLFNGRAAYRSACKEGRVWSAVQACLSELDPSVVAVAGWATPESFAAIDWSRRHRRGLVMMSDSQVSDANRSKWREWIKSRVVGLCDAALVAGPSHCDYINKLGMRRERTFLGYDVVENSHFAFGSEEARKDGSAARLRLGMPERYLLASARFIPKKNLPQLITAYSRALEGRDDAPDLVILGDGPMRGMVQDVITQAGLAGRVHLPGFRSYEDLPALYGLSEGFMHVSTSEQWGLVINEASAAGVPVLASSACGATASLIVDEVTGFVVDPECVVSIKKAMTRLMNLNAKRRNEMGRAAQKQVANWGPERFASGLISAYRVAEPRTSLRLAPWDYLLLRILARKSIHSIQ